MIRVHDLRHTDAMLHLEQGTPVKVVQEILGHSTSTETSGTYSHVTPSMQRAAVDRLESALGRG